MTCRVIYAKSESSYCTENGGDGVPTFFTRQHSPGNDASNGTYSRCNSKKSRVNKEAFTDKLSASIAKHGVSHIVATKMVALQQEKEKIHSFHETIRNLVIHLVSIDVMGDANVTRVIRNKVDKIDEKNNECMAKMQTTIY